MKTAVQQLIERIEKQIELSAHNKLGTNRTGDYRIGLNKALSFAFDALETEREQIGMAYSKGINDDEYGRYMDDYYNETYPNETTN